jgi:prohibitin 1
LVLCGRFLVEKAEQVKTASIISAEGDTEAADLLASAFAKAGEGLVSIQNIGGSGSVSGRIRKLVPVAVIWFYCGSGSGFFYLRLRRADSNLNPL